MQNGIASLICKEIIQSDVKSEGLSSKDRYIMPRLFKVLLNPVLTKIQVNISDFIVAVGVVLDVSAKSEIYVTSI